MDAEQINHCAIPMVVQISSKENSWIFLQLSQAEIWPKKSDLAITVKICFAQSVKLGSKEPQFSLKRMPNSGNFS
jgi:hypothetical protein